MKRREFLKTATALGAVPQVAGSQIHYRDTLMGGGFQIENPEAVSSCGCGTSFRTATSQSSSGGCSHH